jgi:hypothetical protein
MYKIGEEVELIYGGRATIRRMTPSGHYELHDGAWINEREIKCVVDSPLTWHDHVQYWSIVICGFVAAYIINHYILMPLFYAVDESGVVEKLLERVGLLQYLI